MSRRLSRPVVVDAATRRLRTPLRRPTRRERGIALLVVLLMLALLGSVIADFQYNSRVDLQLALNARDGVQAEYNALSALKMRALLLKHSSKLRNLPQALGLDIQLPVTQILEMIPVECGLMSTVIRSVDSGLDQEFAGEGEDGAGQDLFEGECLATSESEHSKISLSTIIGTRRLTTTNPQKQEIAVRLLMSLLSDKRLERHFEEDDRNGTHAESPEELIGAIIDWADPDENQVINRAADEDRFYDLLPKPYEAKNAMFDSLAELQMVHGIDDEMYALLRDNVSIYNEGTQIELATTPTDRILFALMAALHSGVSPDQLSCDPMSAGCEALVHIYLAIEEMRSIGGGFAPFNTAVLSALVNDPTTGAAGLFDPAQVRQIFTDKPSTTWYTIKAQGRMNNAAYRMRVVFQAIEGQFYYVRIE